jgi:glycosyltransferase involved in cell wall biosynthesis
MNIWIFNHHALTPDMSGGTRHYDFAKSLVNRGHHVTIVASSFHYAKCKEVKTYDNKEYIQETIDGIDFIWIKTPPYFGNGIARVRNMLSYTYKVLKIIPRLHLEKPDIIIGSSVHLFAVYAAYRLSKKYHTPFVMEVRDIWPQTLIEMGIPKWHPFIMVLGKLEKYLYEKADRIISNLPYAYEHIGKYVSKEKVIWISNGVDVSHISCPKKQREKNFIVSYTGAMGIANNLTVLVEAAELLKEQKEIFFRIIGEGAQKVYLKNIISRKKLKNITVENAVPKNRVADILCASDLLYLGLKDSPLYRYGMSMNKLYDYMAAGRLIVFATNARNNPLEEAGIGFTISPDDAQALKHAILYAYHLSQEERDEMGGKASAYVQEHYSIEVLTDKLETLLKEEVEKHHA